MRVLVFGDSITQGFWDEDGGWVNYLRGHYDKKQIEDLMNRDEYTIFNLGISADNSKNILERIEPEIIVRTRHSVLPTVIIQIGVNDSSEDDLPQDSVSLSIDKYERNLNLIVEKVRPLSSRIVLVGLSACDEKLTTPVFWGDFRYTNERLKLYENTMKDVATKSKVDFIPVFDRFNLALTEGQDLLSDGLHPNKAGHQVIYEIVKPELEKMLND